MALHQLVIIKKNPQIENLPAGCQSKSLSSSSLAELVGILASICMDRHMVGTMSQWLVDVVVILMKAATPNRRSGAAYYVPMSTSMLKYF